MTKIKIYLILAFFITSIVVATSIYRFNLDTKNQQLENSTDMYLRAYNTVYGEKKQLSKVLSTGLTSIAKIDKRLYKVLHADTVTKDKIRDRLYNDLKNRYKKLKSMGVKQVHIHLADGSSFLRMHNKDRYGDSLVDVRPTVRYVMKYHKPVDTVEEGRESYGVRYVYPIFSHDIYVGSIEVSFSISEITASIMQQYYVLSNFFIKSSIADKKNFDIKKSVYKPSHHKGYYYDKEVLKALKDVTRLDMKQLKPKKATTDKIWQMGQLSYPSSMYDEEIAAIFTIIPISNKLTKENIAFLTVRSKGNIVISNFYTYTIISLSIIVIALIYYIIYFVLSKNYALEIEVKNRIKELREKEQLIIQQSKMATMGEMIGNIAHQWRQPLNVIAIKKAEVVDSYYDDLLTDEMMERFDNDLDHTLQYMSKTIDDFRNFFIPTKEKIEFDIIQSIYESNNIVLSQLKNHNIDLIFEPNDDHIYLVGYPNEFKQVIINLINNAKDAILKRVENSEIDRGNINIYIKNSDNEIYISITDNGGGIPKSILQKVFEPYFTTKFKSQGTGLGLYMSKTIIEKNMSGKLLVKNVKNGAKFTIILYR
jgi:signal transduction histidine kinase